ncbi:MAG: fibrobacter succinogenes major paralogous domain-containing protein [candidate division Zixibacteria bacterium]|nr:fibrobacter succinogenes major paralogous domain-containing protein [candidate division Zixibacteria bacterium]
MDISETHLLRPSDVKTFKLYQGTKFIPNKDNETFVVDLNCVLYDQDGDPQTTGDQIKLDGQYAFTASLFAKIKISWFTLKKFEAGIETNEDANIDLIANLQWEFNEAVEFDLAEFHLGAIPIGGVVWLVPTLTVEAHIHGDLTVTFETGITYTQELRYGFGWADDAYYTISEGTKNFTYTPPQFSAEFNFEPGTSLNASCLLYGVAGPYVAAKAGFHFLAALNADPCNVELIFDLEAILYAVAGIECDLLNLDYNYQWQLYTHLIGQWTYPLGGSGTIIIDPEPDAINAPWSLAGPCSYSSSGNGDLTLNELDPGDYTVTWGEVTGWTTPSNSTQTLTADETVTFSGTYVEDACDCPPTVTDCDGNVYPTVLIGDQCWMMENLKVTHYRNGDPIPQVTDGGTWSGLSSGAYCNYDNDEGNVTTYGRLYNWYAVDDSRNIAPAGWHVPTDEEWKQLEMYLGMSQAEADDDGSRGTDEGGKLKETGTTHWQSPNIGATNESGFTALPGGYRLAGGTGGTFDHMGYYATLWSSTVDYSILVWYRGLHHYSLQVVRSSNAKYQGFSVRCVRD